MAKLFVHENSIGCDAPNNKLESWFDKNKTITPI
jgi:hypothetical protein